MPKKLLYDKIPGLKKAFLFNMRDGDELVGGQISEGDVIAGANGYVAAESTVVDCSARKTVRFNPTRDCEWKTFELRCMVHPLIPKGKVPKTKLRHKGHVVARVINQQVASMARKHAIPLLITPDGEPVINLEVSCFDGQGVERRATLLP
jgi:hypothetical protein